MAIAGLYECFDHWHQEGTVYIYSDPHFGDKELAACQPNRPSDEEQIRLINSKVGRKDTIIFLGDIGDVECVRKIRGYKILIMGNHDAGRTNYERVKYHERFEFERPEEDVIDSMTRLYPGCRYTALEAYDFHAPFVWWDVYADNQLFDEVFEGPLMISEKLILSHEPVNVPWAFNIHGHFHDPKHKNDKHHFNVCSDVIGFTPINFNQWMKQGYLSDIETIHRDCINAATKRKAKREGKKYEKI